MSNGKLRGKAPTGKFELDDYADVMIAFKEWCDARGMNFRAELAAWATTRMTGKDAPAQPAAPPPPSAERVPVPRPNHPGNRIPRAPLVACDDFPGRVFTHAEAGAACGKVVSYPVSRYVQMGRPIPGTSHVFRYATPEEIAAAGFTRRAPTAHAKQPRAWSRRRGAA